MDIFSHALWTNLVFKEIPIEQRSYIISFSVMPDLVSFMKMYGKGFFKKITAHNEEILKHFPNSVQKLYNYTHSFVIWLTVIIIMKILHIGLIMYAFWGWGLHILADIFTHSKKHFPTPILWPISSKKFHGIAWSNKWFLVLNYSALALFYLVFYF